MTKHFPIRLAVLATLMMATAAFAQSGGANGSGEAAGTRSATTGSAPSTATNDAGAAGRRDADSSASGKGPVTNRDIEKQDRAMEAKIKSICKGC